jgi:hypothetical protein
MSAASQSETAGLVTDLTLEQLDRDGALQESIAGLYGDTRAELLRTEPTGPTFSPAASRMAASEYATTTSSACRGSCLSGRRSRFDDMRGVPTSQWRRLVILFGCAALAVLLAFAKPATAQGKPSSRDRVPSELWKTYPLEPSEEGVRTRSSPESDQPQVSPPSSGNVPAGRDDGQPSAVGDDSSAPLALSVFFLSLVGLLVGGLALPALVVRVLEIGKKPEPQTGRAPPTTTTLEESR